MRIKLSFLIFLTILTFHISAQNNISGLKWKELVSKQPTDWYGTDEAKNVADNILLYQRDVGGWPKNIQMHLPLSEKEKDDLRALKKSGNDVTIDNGATVTEMLFMAKMYNKTGAEKYKASFMKGLNYLLEAQYPNGGWPQFYPLKKGYYTHITFNDNAIINVMSLLKSVSERKTPFAFVDDRQIIEKSAKAVEAGINCILKTQYVQNGNLSVWCAQHDENTFLPAKARAYELPSLCGGESAGIVLFLMQIEKPDSLVIRSINKAIEWFEKNKLTGIAVEEYINADGKKDRRVVESVNAPALWARFYELEDNRPFFCGRDGIKKNQLSEIEYERRNGYSWYTDAPQEVIDKFPPWQKRILNK